MKPLTPDQAREIHQRAGELLADVSGVVVDIARSGRKVQMHINIDTFRKRPADVVTERAAIGARVREILGAEGYRLYPDGVSPTSTDFERVLAGDLATGSIVYVANADEGER